MIAEDSTTATLPPPPPRAPDAWERHLGKFIRAQGCATPQDRETFSFACERLARELGIGGKTFLVQLFAELRTRCNMSTNGVVGARFGLNRLQTPVDHEEVAPGLLKEEADASANVASLNAALIEADARRRAASEKLRRIEALTADIIRKRDALAELAAWPAQIEAQIVESEELIRKHVFSLPPLGSVGDPFAWVANIDARSVALRAMLAAHPDRMKHAEAALAAVEAELSELKTTTTKKGKSK